MKINRVEISMFIYILFTTILLLFSHQSGTSRYLSLNVLLSLFIVFMLIIDNRNRLYHFVRIIYPIFILGYFYGETAFLNNTFFKNNLDPFFMDIDQKIFGFQPALMFSKVFYQKWISEILNFAYLSFLFLPIIVTLIFYFFKRELFERVVFIIVTAFLSYYFIFIIFPVFGPQFYWRGIAAQVPVSGIFSKAVKFIQHVGEHPTGAFPSSHVGMSIIINYLLFRYFKKLSYFMMPITFLILFATVYIKAHYAVDVLGGLISAPLIFLLSEFLWNKFTVFIGKQTFDFMPVFAKLKKIFLMFIANKYRF